MGIAYNRYEHQVKLKYSRSKSYFTSNQSVDLYDYYVGTNIQSRRLNIDDVDVGKLFIHSRHSVISGTGGSGKSVLMRHLLLNSLNCSEHTPILIELRDLNEDGTNLNSLILETLETFGLDLPLQYIEKALKNGKFALLLDGFDEVNHELRKKLIRDIKKFISSYSDCPVIISTRPDDVFRGIDELTIFEVKPLSLELAIKLVSKISFDLETKKKFIEALKKQLFKSHNSFLSNPLLLSIMLLTYRENANTPTKLSLFYNQAYEALFHKHDASKSAYTRQRKTNLDIQDFSNAFSLFSLQTYDKRIFKMSRMDCLEYISNSAKILNSSLNPNDFLQDLLSATCLLIEDGLEIAYSHRSFQEYFVALYLSKAKPDIQEKLLNKYLDNLRSDNVISLLYEINQDIVEQKLIIPKLGKIFSTLKIENKVGITHFYKLLNLFFSELIIMKSTFGVTHKSHIDDFMILSFVVDRYNPIENKMKDGFAEILNSKFAQTEEKSYKINKLSSRSSLIKEIGHSECWLSIKFIQNALDAYHSIINKQQLKDKSLENLLGI